MTQIVLLKEIQNFHKSKPTLAEYSFKVRELRDKINYVSKLEIQSLNKLLNNKELHPKEYKQLLEIVEFKRVKYQELVNQI